MTMYLYMTVEVNVHGPTVRKYKFVLIVNIGQIHHYLYTLDTFTYM